MFLRIKLDLAVLICGFISQWSFFWLDWQCQTCLRVFLIFSFPSTDHAICFNGGVIPPLPSLLPSGRRYRGLRMYTARLGSYIPTSIRFLNQPRNHNSTLTIEHDGPPLALPWTLLLFSWLYFYAVFFLLNVFQNFMCNFECCMSLGGCDVAANKHHCTCTSP